MIKKSVRKFKTFQQRRKHYRTYKRLSKILGIKPTKGNNIVLFSDGDDAYDAMLDAIDNANKNINLGTYIFEDDYVGNIFKKKLIKKAKEGVKVKVIYDAVGSRKSPDSFYDEMRQVGIELIKFHPFFNINFVKVNKRYHIKLLIVDGVVGFIGGMNISRHYASDKYKGYHWRDLMIKIEGPAVGDMQTMFFITWLREHKSVLENELEYFPKIDYKGKSDVIVIGNQFHRGNYKIREAFIRLCKNAGRRIYIESAYFLPDRKIRRALRAAKKRGVDVKIIIPRKTDIKPVYYARRATYCKSLKAGIEIYEYYKHVLHTKLAIFDNTTAVIGSANFDYRSFFINVEGSVIIDDAAFVDKITDVFFNDLKVSDKVELEKFKKRSVFVKFVEKLFFMFRYFL